MTIFDDAKDELRRLESHWISLLSWLSEKTGVSADDLVKAWSADDYYKASSRLTADTKKAAGANWTILDFIDFASYVHLASRHSDKLTPLGAPPKDWVARINKQMASDGLTAFRNHLQHANRFAKLPKSEQERGSELLRTQNALLTKWWPSCPVTTKAATAESPLRSALRALSAFPDDTTALVEELGMRSIANARNLIEQSGVPSALTKQLEGDLNALYEVGEIELGGARASIYLASVNGWQPRSARREPVRRRVSKALRERAGEEQRVIIFVDATGKSAEAEFVLPRVRSGKGVGTVRAAVSMVDPTRHHVQLLESLRVQGSPNIPALARKWIEAFSVETVTTRFYTEFRDLRDRLIDDLLAHNADNPALQRDRKKDLEYDLELHAFGTRQLSRILFLWFLQQKRWLGNSAGDGNLNFLTDLFRDHGGKGDAFFADVLTPIFFNGLGRRTSDPKHRAAEAIAGALPYLGGGIFTLGANEFEAQVYALNDEGEATRRVVLSDDLFDPRKDDAEGATTKAKSRKRSVLGLLRGYRFTTQESTPDDQSIDPDPELLGKVFENLYQADERHATGAYYTPREIVQFMCRRTLDAYLIEQTGVTQDTLDWLREEAVDWAASDRKLSPADSDALVLALERVRVLDPAVGSGAFLLTMMHEIVTLRRGIEQSELDKDVEKTSIDVADWKRRVATDSLYGVDINPMAVEICHLRLWLSIIVDLEVSNYRQIPALPNLDFRIVAGDSLIDRMGAEPFFESLPRDEKREIELWLHTKVMDFQKELDALKNKFTLAEGAAEKDQKRLRDLRQRIRAKQVEIAQVQLAHSLDKAEADLNLLQGPKAKPATKKKIADVTAHAKNLRALQSGLRADAPYQKPFLWPVNFHDVFEAGGFDIVLANPPYVRMEGIDNLDEASYGRAFPEVARPRADLLVYFYSRAVQVLRTGGQLAFITSNSFVKRAYGAGVRQFLGDQLAITTVVDFGESKVFDAVVEPYVLTARKGPAPVGHEVDGHYLYIEIARRTAGRNTVSAVREQLEDLASLLSADHVRMPQSTFLASGWAIESPEIIALVGRLMNQGAPLGDYVQGRMYAGVKTGLNQAFVIDEATRDAFISSDPVSAELIRPWLRGRDIKRWRPDWRGLYIIFAHRGIDIKKYPAIRQHLLRYRDALNRRATVGQHPWYELQQPQEGIYHEFEHEKIVWPEFARSVRFCRTAPGVMTNNKCFFWPESPHWALPVLNSELIEFLLYQITRQIRGGFVQLYDHFVRQLPIVVPSSGVAKALEGFAAKMIVNPLDNETEPAIEAAVRSVYRLSQDDSDLIDAWFAKRSLAAADDDTDELDGDDDA